MYLKRFYRSDIEPNKIMKAKELIAQNKILKIKGESSSKEFYYIKGRKMNYLVVKNTWCSCSGFLRSVLNKKEKPCYHLIACFIKNEKYDPSLCIDKPYELFDIMFKNNKYDKPVKI